MQVFLLGVRPALIGPPAVQELLRSEPLALGAAAAGSSAARKERDLGGGAYLPAFNARFDA